MESMELWMKANDKNKDNMDPNDLYPWLPDTDIRKRMTDNEILDKFVNLDKSILTEQEKEDFCKIHKHKKAFLLQDKIGTCPDLLVHLELNNKEPFQIQPFACKEEHKKYLDKEMKKGCILGILKQAMSAWNSPMMLISWKIGPPQIMTDFQFLNS